MTSNAATRVIAALSIAASVIWTSPAAEPESLRNGSTPRRSSDRTGNSAAAPGPTHDRVLLLAPGGPVLIEVHIVLYGRPLREFREKLVDASLRQADTDGDGRPTWDELLRNPRFNLAQAFNVSDDRRRQAYVRLFDRNADGTVDREEARAFVAQAGGAQVQVASNFGGSSQPDVMGLLDTDRNGTISAEEIAAAPERLSSRDYNDNDLVESDEVGIDSLAAYRVGGKSGRVASGVRSGAVFPLGDNMNAAAINYALKQRYGKSNRLKAECFPLFPKLVESLDRNGNREIDLAELEGFRTIKPHIAVTLHLGVPSQKGSGPAEEGIRLRETVPEVASVSPASDKPASDSPAAQADFTIPGVLLQITAARIGALQDDFERQAKDLVSQYDSDKNGYLEKKDFDDNPARDDLLPQFEKWDENGDGKAFPDEVAAVRERDAALERSRVSVSAGDRGPALFSMLDPSGDGRLGRREVREAAARLKSLDKNGDDRLTADELPSQIVVRFAGTSGSPDGTAEPQQPAIAASQEQGPRWFQHMDKNGDGDVTSREFLGTREQFQRFDANQDGFIEPAEAAKAGRGK